MRHPGAATHFREEGPGALQRESRGMRLWTPAAHAGRRSTARLAIALACAAPSLAVPAAAHALAPSEAVRLLNAQRAANGIPGDLVEAPGLSDGCAKHGAYIALNGGALTQGEDPAKPGYTPEGDRQTLASSAPQALSSDPRWSDTANPWLLQPISLYRLFDPEIAAVGYNDDKGVACMRVAGGRPPAQGPELYSLPGNGRTGVPFSEVNHEAPYVPQQLAGIAPDQATGPNILLFTRGLRGSAPLSASAFSLTGPAGPVDARLITEATQTDAGTGSWFRGGGVLVPVAPLAPFQTYVARVTWHRDAAADLPAADAEQVVGFETEGMANSIDVTVTTSGALNVIRVTTAAPNPTLTLNGPGDLTDIAVLKKGEARYDDLDPGQWEACAKSGGKAFGYFVASICKPFMAAAKVQLALPLDRGTASVPVTVPRVAAGRIAQVTISRYRRPCKVTNGRNSCKRQTVGHAQRLELKLRSPATRLKLPAARPGVKVTARIVLPAFTVAGKPYLRAEIRRTWE